MSPHKFNRLATLSFDITRSLQKKYQLRYLPYKTDLSDLSISLVAIVSFLLAICAVRFLGDGNIE